MAGIPQRRNRGGFNQRDNKNFNNSNNNSSNMSGNRIEFRFLIPSRAASIIIGKGGERIQRLRHECNARLSIPDNHGPERVFVLESTMENCIKVWRDCLPDLKDVMGGSFNMESRRGSGSFRDDPEIDLRFLVHDSLVGAVIGKGGANVKNLRLQYHLSVVKVFPSTAPLSSDRIIQIVGKFENMFDCFRATYQTLEGQNIKGNIENYNAANFDDNLVSSYGGWGSNQGGFENSNNRKSNPPLIGANNDRNLPQNGRFNNKPAPNDSFFNKSDMGRGNNLPKPLLNNRFDNFANDNFKNDMDRDKFPKQHSFNNRMSSSSFEQNYPGIRKRMNSNNDSDMNNDINKRGRMRPNNFEPRNENNNYNNNNNNNNNNINNNNNRPNHFDPRNDNRNNFFDNRNDNKPMNRNENPMGRVPPMINSNVPPASNLPFSEKIEVLIPTTLMHAIGGYDSDILSNISNDSGADINILNMDDEHDSDAIVSLSGTKDQIEGAQYLLQICIKKSVLNL